MHLLISLLKENNDLLILVAFLFLFQGVCFILWMIQNAKLMRMLGLANNLLKIFCEAVMKFDRIEKEKRYDRKTSHSTKRM